MTVYDPEKWLETAIRGIKEYVEANINTRIYEVVMEFPTSASLAKKMPLRKTLIHFEIDDSTDRVIGFGAHPTTWNYNEVDQSVNPQWAGMHRLNFDVGVWSSDDTGGTTARMRARQELQRLFGFASSIEALRQATMGADGCVEILNFTGGSYTEDREGDIRLFRTVNGALEVRVFSRSPLAEESAPAIESIVQNPHLTIIG